MTMTKTEFWSGVVVLALIMVLVGWYFAPKTTFGASPSGTTFNTAKVAGVSILPASSAASSTSILNTDANGRWVKSLDAGCTGVGTGGTSVATMTVQAATTTVANEGLQGNTNLAANETIATSTSFSQSATSTLASATSANTDLYYWPAGTYMTFLFNTTNTASCALSMSYFAS